MNFIHEKFVYLLKSRSKLAHKIIFLSSLVLLLSFSCLGFYFISYQKELLYADMNELADTLAANLAANAAFGLVTHDRDQLQGLLESLGQCRDIVYAWIEDVTGSKLACYSNTQWIESYGLSWKEISGFMADSLKLTSDEPDGKRRPDNKISGTYEPEHGPAMLFVCVPVTTERYGSKDELVIGHLSAETKRQQLGKACLTMSLRRVNDSIKTASWRSFGIVAIIAVAAIFMSRFLAHWIAIPLIRLRDAADEMTAGILPSVIDVQSEDEVGELAAAFNKMVEQVLQGKKALEKAYQELEKTNMSLEEQVVARTEELRESVMELTAARDCLQDAYAEMKSMHDAKSGFLRTASHEFRTPLTAIKANVDYLLKYERERIGKDGLEMLEAVGRNTNNMRQLVEEMLQVVRLDSDSVELDIRPARLYDVISECAGELRAIQSCSLKIDVEKDLVVHADRAKLHDVFINLLGNAYRFTPSDGEVVIRGERTGGAVKITVSDTGCGMDGRHLAQIFEPFYQVEHGKGGTGLGLTIVRGIIERHGGEIDVFSEPGKGTVFTIFIPDAGEYGV
jgi:signal transduction histidine kinase